VKDSERKTDEIKGKKQKKTYLGRKRKRKRKERKIERQGKRVRKTEKEREE